MLAISLFPTLYFAFLHSRTSVLGPRAISLFPRIGVKKQTPLDAITDTFKGRPPLERIARKIFWVKLGRNGPTPSIFGHNKRTIWGEFGLPIMCNFPAAPSPQRRTPRAVFQTPFVSNHPFSQINSEAHKVMLHPPSPLMTGATFKCKQLPFDSPDVTLV